MKIRELIKSLQKTTPGLKWTVLVGQVGTIQWNFGSLECGVLSTLCYYAETSNLEVISSEESIGFMRRFYAFKIE